MSHNIAYGTQGLTSNNSIVLPTPPAGRKPPVEAALQFALREVMMSPLIGKSMGTHGDDHGTFGPRTSATLERG